MEKQRRDTLALKLNVLFSALDEAEACLGKNNPRISAMRDQVVLLAIELGFPVKRVDVE